MVAADISPYELVHINSMRNAVHWVTYAIPGKRGEICLNGCPAHLFEPGDQVIILSLGHYEDSDLATFAQKVVIVDDKNAIVSFESKLVSA